MKWQVDFYRNVAGGRLGGAGGTSRDMGFVRKGVSL